jgi:hypothetical protein
MQAFNINLGPSGERPFWFNVENLNLAIDIFGSFDIIVLSRIKKGESMFEGRSQIIVKGGNDPIPLPFSSFATFGKKKVATKTGLVIKLITIIPNGPLDDEQVFRLAARIEEVIRERAEKATSWRVLEDWLEEKATVVVGGHMWPRHLTSFVRKTI